MQIQEWVKRSCGKTFEMRIVFNGELEREVIIENITFLVFEDEKRVKVTGNNFELEVIDIEKMTPIQRGLYFTLHILANKKEFLFVLQ